MTLSNVTVPGFYLSVLEKKNNLVEQIVEDVNLQGDCAVSGFLSVEI